jgi:acid phosphatase type 7
MLSILLSFFLLSAPAKKTATPKPTPTAVEEAVLIAAGDVARCEDLTMARATTKLLDKIPGTIAVLGDLTYPHGRPAEFAECYAPTWGKHRARTRPAVGNHDYETKGASAYFAFWGAAAGDPAQGYYSYELGKWHIVVLNSNCREVGGCHAGSLQERWLREDLEAHETNCTLAYWHHPLFSSGIRPAHAQRLELRPLWQALHEAGADVALAGHEHNYETFGPQDAMGNADPKGIRSFVVGTGGTTLTPLTDPRPNSEVREWKTHGVLKLTLRPKDYSWEFVPVKGADFKDSGSAACH